MKFYNIYNMNNQKYLTMKKTKEKVKENEVTKIQIGYQDPNDLLELRENLSFAKYVHEKTLEKIKYALNNNLDKVEIFNIFNMALIIELEKTNFKDALVKMNSIYIDEEDFEKCAELQKIINKL